MKITKSRQTHLPVDAPRFCPKAKCLSIGRDGRDVVWSMYNHHANAYVL
jgi:aryl sulfotransferase